MQRQLAPGLLLLLLLAAPALAQNGVLFSPDITADLGTVLTAVVGHHRVAGDDGAGSVGLALPLSIPSNVDVIGYEPIPGTDESLLSFDTTVALPGLPPGMPAEPRDVVLYDASTALFSFAFDGSSFGVPLGTAVDAVGVDAGGDLLLSFDTSVSLAGVGAVDDEDLVQQSGLLFSMVFDGSVNGVTPGLDLDGASLQPGGTDLLLSFDATGAVGALVFDDEDAILFDTTLQSYAMHFDASLSDPVDWPAADLVALPEPGGSAPPLLAAALLARLARRRTLAS